MIELHGWLTIRTSYKNEDDNNRCVQDTIDKIQEKIKSLQWNEVQLNARNGVHFIETSIYANRKNDEIIEIIQFFEDVASIAVGSYGMIYCWDDEDTEGKENEFQVYTIAKGKIVRKEDHHLFPCIPTIEEE